MENLGPLLGSGNVADVHAFGTLALELYKSANAKVSAFREAANLAIVQELKFPTPKVHQVGLYFERWGIAMDRAPDAIDDEPAGGPERRLDARSMAELHASLHECSGSGLPSLKERLSSKIAQVDKITPLTKMRLVERLETLPAGDRVCHGDFHPWNVIGSGSCRVIVDWLDACSGHPTADVCRSYLLLHSKFPDAAEQYLSAYCRLACLERELVMRWLPVLAAARLTEQVPNEEKTLVLLAQIE